jgi:hypothetical protein
MKSQAKYPGRGLVSREDLEYVLERIILLFGEIGDRIG